MKHTWRDARVNLPGRLLQPSALPLPLTFPLPLITFTFPLTL